MQSQAMLRRLIIHSVDLPCETINLPVTMDLNIEDLNKVITTFVSNNCSDESTEQCLKKLILYTSENDILLSHLSSILISAKNQMNCLFKSLTALHYTINRGDKKFLHYLASNNLNFVNLDKQKHKFNNANAEYLAFMKRYIKYLQQKISVYKFINMESSWLAKLTQKAAKSQQSNNASVQMKSDESVLQHDIIGEQLMRKISFIENQIDYLITEFNVEKLSLLFNSEILENNDLNTKRTIVEQVCSLLLSDVINYANYYQDIMSELIEEFELMNRKHCKDAIEIYRKLPDKIQHLRIFLVNANHELMIANRFQPIDLNELMKPSIEMQEKMEQHWKILESKPKRKNSERRKEKSKYAARVRRGEESDLLNELSECVPLPDVKQQDKASVMRLAIAFINTKQFVKDYFQNECKNQEINKPTTVQIVNSLTDGIDECDDQIDVDYLDVLKTSNLILTLLSLDGDLVYISQNVINLIGLKQNEMLGMSIFDFVHPCDHDELKNALKQIGEETTNGAKKDETVDRAAIESFDVNELADLKRTNGTVFGERKYISFMVRIKCTLNNKSKCVPLKSANYKMASFSGYLKNSKTKPLLVLSVDILLSPSAQLKCAGSSVFVSKHTPDLKFINADEKLTSLFGYEEKDLIGFSFFQYIHASDAFQLFNSFQKLLAKGEVETGYYRLLAKTGGYFWVQTKASLLTDYSTQKPQTILCVHYLISELISSGIILSSKQSLSAQEPIKALTDENTSIGKKKASKKGKPKITKTNLNSKAFKKCQSQSKSRKSLLNIQNSDVALRERNDLSKNSLQNDEKFTDDELVTENLNHFVQDCREFDTVLERIKFKEQFKKEYEAQLNSRMNKPTIEPVFNTFSVFAPIEEDQYIEIEPSIDNSPLIATPPSIAYASKVDMTCMPYDSSSNDIAYDTDSPDSNLSNSMNCDSLYGSPNDYSCSTTYIPEIDELKTTIGNTLSIFSPLTDDLNSNFYIACDDNMKKIDFDDTSNLIQLAPSSGDIDQSVIGLDFDELPSSLDAETEKLIKEISFTGSRSDSLNAAGVRTVQNSTIRFNESRHTNFDSYTSSSKSVKIPNHFNNLESEIAKKPRISFVSSASKLINSSNSKLNSSSVLLNLLVTGKDVNHGYP